MISARHYLARQLGDHPKWRWAVGMPVLLGEHEHIVTAVAAPLAGYYRVGLYLSGMEVDGDGDPLCRLTCEQDGAEPGEWARVDDTGGAYNAWPAGTGPIPAWWHPAALGFLRARICRAARHGWHARALLNERAPSRDLGMVGAETHARVLLDLWNGRGAIRATFEEP